VTDYRVWPATNGPDTSGSDGTPINLGLEFYVTAQAWCTHARVYRGTADVEPDNLRLYLMESAAAGTVLAEATNPVFSGVGWQEIAFDPPVELTPLQAYKVASHNPDHYTATGGYWAPGGPGEGGRINGILVAPDTNQTAAQATFGYGAPGFPTGTFGGGNYWVDVVVTDVDPSGGEVDSSGTAAAASEANATLTVTRALDGLTSGAVAGIGGLDAARDLAGSPAGAATAAAALAAARAIAGTASAADSGSAALTVAAADNSPRFFTPGRVGTNWTSGRVSTSWTAGPLEA